MVSKQLKTNILKVSESNDFEETKTEWEYVHHFENIKGTCICGHILKNGTLFFNNINSKIICLGCKCLKKYFPSPVKTNKRGRPAFQIENLGYEKGFTTEKHILMYQKFYIRLLSRDINVVRLELDSTKNDVIKSTHKKCIIDDNIRSSKNILQNINYEIEQNIQDKVRLIEQEVNKRIDIKKTELSNMKHDIVLLKI